MLAVQVGLIVASYLLRPRYKEEEDRKSRGGLGAGVDGTPVPIVYGRVRVDNPVVMWWGHTFTTSTNTPIYGLSMAVGVGLACPMASSAATLHRIWIGDRLWFDDDEPGLRDNDSTGGGVVHKDTADILFRVGTGAGHQNFFGGDKAGGGFHGRIEWFGGGFEQNRSFLLQESGLAASQLPAYRGVAYVAFRVVIGETPTLRNMAFEIEIQPDALGYGTVGTLGDANPAECLWDIIKSDWGRAEISGWNVHGASFTAAAATLDAENHGIAMVVTNGTASDAVADILRQIDGILYEEPISRRLKLKLVRDDYDVGDLPVYDPSDIIEMIEYTVAQLEPTANRVRVTFRARGQDYAPRVAMAQDEAGIVSMGRVKNADMAFPGVSSYALAKQIAERELRFLSRPLIQMRILCNRRAASLRPGDVILVAWPDYQIDGVVMRVQSSDWGTLDDGRVTLNLTQDLYSVGFDVS